MISLFTLYRKWCKFFYAINRLYPQTCKLRTDLETLWPHGIAQNNARPPLPSPHPFPHPFLTQLYFQRSESILSLRAHFMKRDSISPRAMVNTATEAVTTNNPCMFSKLALGSKLQADLTGQVSKYLSAILVTVPSLRYFMICLVILGSRGWFFVMTNPAWVVPSGFIIFTCRLQSPLSAVWISVDTANTALPPRKSGNMSSFTLQKRSFLTISSKATLKRASV